jgi:polyisoprenyl-phosphate glycosyltransferase
MQRAGVPEISVVVPLFDEQENVAELHRRVAATIDDLGITAEIVLVDDGSRDATPRLLDALAARDPRVVVLHLTRNFGHQAAVTAGIDGARGRAVVVMDADLQDPPELLGDFVKLWRAGNEVVYAVRTRRKEHLFKRAAYSLFYRMLRAIGEVDIPRDSGDFCLMDRRVVDALKSLPERVRFVRGLRAFVGFRQVGLTYDRPGREQGQTKYPLRKLVALGIDGLVSFSARPLRIVTTLGIVAATIALLLTGWVVADSIAMKTAPRGWASTIVVVLFMGSVQLISLGVIGEYIRLIFLETKGRPTYLVRDRREADVDRPVTARFEPRPSRRAS